MVSAAVSSAGDRGGEADIRWAPNANAMSASDPSRRCGVALLIYESGWRMHPAYRARRPLARRIGDRCLSACFSWVNTSVVAHLSARGVCTPEALGKFLGSRDVTECHDLRFKRSMGSAIQAGACLKAVCWQRRCLMTWCRAGRVDLGLITLPKPARAGINPAMSRADGTEHSLRQSS